MQAYSLELAAFRLAAPEAYAAWQNTWRSDGPDSPTFTDASRTQRSTDDATDLGVGEIDRVEYSFANGDPDVSGQAVVAFALTPEGIVNLAIIIDPVNDFRAEYILHDVVEGADALITQLDGLTWTDS